MYARGMSVREIGGHLEEIYGIDVSPDLISAVTDAVLDDVAEWQNRPLDVSYPLVFFDALRVKIRDEGFVATRRSTSRWASCLPAPKIFWVCGSNKPKAPSSGCAS
jgi:putative transposase